jgi:outer membrane protein OmpA-like peptidoglycan-associated protein
MIVKNIWRTIACGVLIAFAWNTARAQEGLGPFMPHNGGTLTTAWTNAYGPDAESWIRFANVGTSTFDINYNSSRGMVAVRRLPVVDRQNGRTLVLGYNAKMPLIIPGTTVLGTSTAVVDELRQTGRASLGLIPDTSLNVMPGSITMAEPKIKMPMAIDGQVVQIPAFHVQAQFASGNRAAQGDMYFLDNRNNPILIQYSLQFTGEKTPRTERIVSVTAGPEMQAAMAQSLATVREYTTRGIHFDFDKASIQPNSYGLIDEIAQTLNDNPLWTLQITGHTDSIGDPNYNKKLSLQRAQSVMKLLVKRGIQPSRLSVAGAGAGQPVASNKTLEGRALNRRVVLTRTDR